MAHGRPPGGGGGGRHGGARPALCRRQWRWSRQPGLGIPIASDIAFALGVVSLLGSRVPGPLKLFLLTLAIVDDIGAIAVIAIFYSGGITWPALAVAAALVLVMAGLRRARVRSTAPFAIVGVGCGWRCPSRASTPPWPAWSSASSPLPGR